MTVLSLSRITERLTCNAPILFHLKWRVSWTMRRTFHLWDDRCVFALIWLSGVTGCSKRPALIDLFHQAHKEGRPGMSDVSPPPPRSGISRLSFDSTLLSPPLLLSCDCCCSFCLVRFLLMAHSPDPPPPRKFFSNYIIFNIPSLFFFLLFYLLCDFCLAATRR